jgi:hypothetical protein
MIQKVIMDKKCNVLQSGLPLALHSEAGKHAAQAHMAALPTGRCKARVPADKSDWSRGELTFNRQTAHHGLRSLHPYGCLAIQADAPEKVREDFIPRGKMKCHLRYEVDNHEYILLSVDGSSISKCYRVQVFPTIFPMRLRSPCNIASLSYQSETPLEAIQKEVHTRPQASGGACSS